MDVDELKRRCQEQFCVAVDEEYGFQKWIWFPPVPRTQIEAFWEAQGDLGWWPNKFLPGEWVAGVNGDEGDQFYKLFYGLWRSPDHYALHYDGQSSSGLLTPDGRAIFHATFDTEDDNIYRKEIILWAEQRIHPKAERPNPQEWTLGIDELKRRCQEQFCIAVNEKYRFREWIWFPPVPRTQIETFWETQGNLGPWPDNCLPGEWVGRVDGDEDDQLYELFCGLWRSPDHYALHYNGQDSTGLLTPDGRAVFHATLDDGDESASRKEIVWWAKQRIRPESA